MHSRALQIVPWFVGVAFVVGIFLYFGPDALERTFSGLHWRGLLVWGVLTLIARLMLVETVRLPLRVLGFDVGRRDLFWFNCIRAFANQIVPLSGLAAFAHMLRRRLRITWSELAALAAPQFVLALVALGVVGVVAVIANYRQLGPPGSVLLAFYLIVFVVSLSISSGGAWLIDGLPLALSRRAANVAVALREFHAHPWLVTRLVVYHGVAIVLRSGRLWVLFAAADIALPMSQVLLVVAIAESTMLLNVTPGGLGVREGAILGAAALIGVDPEVAAGVAVLDRLLMIGITVFLAPPAFAFLRTRPSTTESE